MAARHAALPRMATSTSRVRPITPKQKTQYTAHSGEYAVDNQAMYHGIQAVGRQSGVHGGGEAVDARSNSVAFSALNQYGMDTVKDFPPIRVFGTVGFIVTMLAVNFLDFQTTAHQFFLSGALSLVLAFYAPTLPACPVSSGDERKSLFHALGLDAFSLFRERRMAIFFLFSMLLGVSLQITNGYANPFIMGFKDIPEFANTFGANNANALISLSQISETCCILLIPFFLKRFGIKRVMMIAMFAWVLRFGLFATGDPGSGVWMMPPKAWSARAKEDSVSLFSEGTVGLAPQK